MSAAVRADGSSGYYKMSIGVLFGKESRMKLVTCVEKWYSYYYGIYPAGCIKM